MARKHRRRIAWSLIPDGVDKSPLALAGEVRELLGAVKDEGTSVDSGFDVHEGVAYLWVTAGGREFFITVQKSRREIGV